MSYGIVPSSRKEVAPGSPRRWAKRRPPPPVTTAHTRVCPGPLRRRPAPWRKSDLTVVEATVEQRAPTPTRIFRRRSASARDRLSRIYCNYHAINADFDAPQARPNRAGHDICGPSPNQQTHFQPHLNAQSNARYVSAVVSRSMAHDARKGARWRHAAPTSRRCSSGFARRHLRSNPPQPSPPPPRGSRPPSAIVARRRSSTGSPVSPNSSARPTCAPAAPAGATAAEVAAVLGAPLQRKRLEFSTDSPDERARRLAKLLGARSTTTRSSAAALTRS